MSEEQMEQADQESAAEVTAEDTQAEEAATGPTTAPRRSLRLTSDGTSDLTNPRPLGGSTTRPARGDNNEGDETMGESQLGSKVELKQGKRVGVINGMWLSRFGPTQCLVRYDLASGEVCEDWFHSDEFTVLEADAPEAPTG